MNLAIIVVVLGFCFYGSYANSNGRLSAQYPGGLGLVQTRLHQREQEMVDAMIDEFTADILTDNDFRNSQLEFKEPFEDPEILVPKRQQTTPKPWTFGSANHIVEHQENKRNCSQVGSSAPFIVRNRSFLKPQEPVGKLGRLSPIIVRHRSFLRPDIRVLQQYTTKPIVSGNDGDYEYYE